MWGAQTSVRCTQDRALDVVVHAMALPSASAAPPEVEAAVVGPGRPLPEVKHSQWVEDRWGGHDVARNRHVGSSDDHNVALQVARCAVSARLSWQSVQLAGL